MTHLSLKDISDVMKEIDICIMTTKTPSGELDSRPMSNNKNVDYEGDSYYFTYQHYPVVQEIRTDPRINLGYSHHPALLGKPTYISISGKASVTTDRGEMEKYWSSDLKKWFENGLDTPDIAMIRVHAERIKYWHGMDEGEIDLNAGTHRKIA